MNKIKHIVTSIVLLVCIIALLCACSATGGEKEYSVTVQNYLGDPCNENVIVEFMQNGTKAGMQVCDDKGVATKVLPSGNYDIVLRFSENEDAYYYESGITATSKNNKVSVTVAKKITGEPSTLFAGGSEHNAYGVTAGSTYIELEDGRNYFLFTPTEAGTYEFSVSNGADAGIGYYGAPHFVQEINIAELVDGKFTISVKQGMIGSGEGGTSTYVIGVDKNSDADCVLGIQRIGDPEFTIEDEPWEIYQKTTELSAYTLPDGYSIGEFDITKSTDAYNIVFNESDGYYHLDSADGPLVLVRLTEDCDFIACFATMLDRSGVTKYFFDDNGGFVKKVSYSECLFEYIEYAEENEGVYPLTEDLKHIIQSRGEYVGWWDIDGSGYIFKDNNGANRTDINPEIAWLMMCCYLEK